MVRARKSSEINSSSLNPNATRFDTNLLINKGTMADMGGTEVIIGGAIITAIVAVVAYSLMGNGSSSEVQKKVTSGSQSNGSANKTEGSNKESRKKYEKKRK